MQLAWEEEKIGYLRPHPPIEGNRLLFGKICLDHTQVIRLSLLGP